MCARVPQKKDHICTLRKHAREHSVMQPTSARQRAAAPGAAGAGQEVLLARFFMWLQPTRISPQRLSSPERLLGCDSGPSPLSHATCPCTGELLRDGTAGAPRVASAHASHLGGVAQSYGWRRTSHSSQHSPTRPAFNTLQAQLQQ